MSDESAAGLRAFRAGGPPVGGIMVELVFDKDWNPGLFYGHEGFAYEEGQRLRRWLEGVTPNIAHHILTDTGPSASADV